MRVLMTGATGLIGKEIGKKLFHHGHEVVVLTRDRVKAKGDLPFPATIIEWDLKKIPKDAIEGTNAVINLAGESIADGRWNERRKKLIHDSRVFGTRTLVEAFKKSKDLKHFISTSAVGIYGDRGDEILTEKSKEANDFLAKVCKEWEAEANKISSKDVGVTCIRLGIVLARWGGAMKKMLPLFSLGLGGPVGGGKQWMSWIHLEDVSNIFVYCLEKKITGVINAVSPEPHQNESFSHTLATAMNRKMFLPAPAIALKLALGEMSQLVLDSQRVSSDKIRNLGYHFQYPTLKAALKQICDPLRDGQKEVFAEQWVPMKSEEIFEFFSDENNLEKITPAFLNFKVLKKSTKVIEKGTLIDYKLSLHGIPVRWKTLIESWDVNKSFVDTQMKGPYQKWHHTHEFIPMGEGTLMRDTVHYQIPVGRVGELVMSQKIASDVENIFKFRRKVIVEKFFNA